MFQKMFPMIIGPLYVLIGTVGIFVLLKSRKLGNKTRIAVLTVSAILGLITFTPMFPVQFQQLLLGQSPDDKPIVAVASIIMLLLMSTVAVGRIFCGYLCPIGALQELTYLLQFKKMRGQYGRIFSITRFIAFFILIGSAVLGGVSILDWFGLTSFFHLQTVSPFFYVFVVILIISIFLYRPFCRIACPLGFLMSLTSRLSKFRIRTGTGCTSCQVCEKQCPTRTAIVKPERFGECYLCLRCAEKCARDAVVYRG